SQRDAVDARTALATARAEEVRAAAVLQSMGAAGAGAGTYTLRAPIAGTVVRRALRVGVQARPDAAEPAFLIADLDRVWVLAHLHEAQGASVRAGDRVEIEVPALPGRRFESVVDRVAEAVDPNAHTLEVRVRVPNPDHALKPEMFARVTVRTGSAGVALTPIGALITDPNGYAVFVEDTPGHFERRQVVVGAEFNGQAQVRSGLRVGERVVVEGALLLDASAERVL
ncbi:MAG: efflux transporter, family, subunit, partial [Myxococcaceae bacterium]|nr:efflux transporter, family, subunit [Myxococcaceae bacterium]